VDTRNSASTRFERHAGTAARAITAPARKTVLVKRVIVADDDRRESTRMAWGLLVDVSAKV
jgi:hypothetical protein